jgi:hypothetical protein
VESRIQNPESRMESEAFRAAGRVKRAGGLALALSLLVVAPYAGAALSVGEMMQFLEDRGLPGASTLAAEGAITGLIRSIDSEARICTPEEAASIRAQWTGVDQSGGTNGGGAGSVDTFEAWPEGLAYLKIRGLYRGGGVEIMGHLRTLSEGSGVIMDLRGTDGADLDAVVALASPFYCAGDVLFRVENRAGVPLETHVAGEVASLKTPLMVLIDHDTRCAAETLVALWNGKPGVMLIGESTRGDTGVRDLLPLPDGRFLYMATKKLVPVATAYGAKGVRPDVVVDARVGGVTPLVPVPGHGRPLSAKSVEDRDLMMRVDSDPALRRGTDILLALRAMNDHGRH